MLLEGPRKAMFGNKTAPNRLKTTYRSVLTSEEKKQSITHLFKTFSGLDSVVMRLFWQKGRKIRSTERLKLAPFGMRDSARAILSLRSTVGQ